MKASEITKPGYYDVDWRGVARFKIKVEFGKGSQLWAESLHALLQENSAVQSRDYPNTKEGQRIAKKVALKNFNVLNKTYFFKPVSDLNSMIEIL